jgi:hypothetical protein
MIETIKEYLAKEDLVALYGVLAEDMLEEDGRRELESEMLNIAREKMHDKMAEQKRFDFDNKSEQFVLRVLYDDALGFYEAGEYYESGEAFALLAAASNSKLFEKSVKKHLLAVQQKVSFETFIDEWVEDKVLKHFFVSKFTKTVEKSYKAELSVLNASVQRYAKLFN